MYNRRRNNKEEGMNEVMVMTQWLAERMEFLLDRLRGLDVSQEEEIAELCAQEIAAWRARPTMRVVTSLKVPMSDARNVLRARLAVTDLNSWFNPRDGKREHLALKYLNFSNEEWIEINGPSEQAARQRREDPQFFPHPEAVVQKAENLLASSYWQDVALGLSVLTGRRVTETLKTSTFHPQTDWTVTFSGQLKRRDAIMIPYEIPTLIRADLVLSAWQRLRGMLDCSALTKEEVDARYAGEVRAVATRHFGHLIPTRAGHEEQLYTHLFRCIYGQIAVLYFAPSWVLNLDYLATIYGHYWDATPGDSKKSVSYSSTMHYMDYRIVDGLGQVDLRQGIRLGEPGVGILKVFQPKKKEKAVKSQDEPQATIVTKKSSLFRCTPQVKERGRQLMEERDIRDKQKENTFLSQVFDESVLYRQMCTLLAPLAATAETDPLTTLHDLLTAFEQPAVQQRLVSDHLQQRWGVTLDDLDQVFTQVREAGHEQPLAYVQESLSKRDNFRAGAQKRANAFQQLDYATMPFAELEGMKTAEAAEERIRRAVQAIMVHNESADKLAHWYINAAAIKELVGGRYPVINAYLDAHQSEIQAHHDALGIKPHSNHKVIPIAEMVKIPGQVLTLKEKKQKTPSVGD